MIHAEIDTPMLTGVHHAAIIPKVGTTVINPRDDNITIIPLTLTTQQWKDETKRDHDLNLLTTKLQTQQQIKKRDLHYKRFYTAWREKKRLILEEEELFRKCTRPEMPESRWCPKTCDEW